MFDERKHPRDEKGKFTDKETDGKGKTYRQNAQYDEILQVGKKPNYTKYKNRIQSKVFDKISTVKKVLRDEGHCFVTVYEFDKKYRVKLYGVDKDYDFGIIKIKPIK